MSKELTAKETLLTIYGQYSWHTEAVILGNNDSLKRLRDAIDKTLNTPADESGKRIICDEFMQDDGEGYSLVIISDEKHSFNDLNNYPVSYTDDVAQSHSETEWKKLSDVYNIPLRNHLEQIKLKHQNKS